MEEGPKKLDEQEVNKKLKSVLGSYLGIFFDEGEDAYQTLASLTRTQFKEFIKSKDFSAEEAHFIRRKSGRLFI